LQFADVEAAVARHGTRRVEHERPPLEREVAVGRGQLGIETRAEPVDRVLHQVVAEASMPSASVRNTGDGFGA